MRCYVLLFGHFFAMEDIKIFESNEFGNVRIVLDEKRCSMVCRYGCG